MFIDVEVNDNIISQKYNITTLSPTENRQKSHIVTTLMTRWQTSVLEPELSYINKVHVLYNSLGLFHAYHENKMSRDKCWL